MDCRISSRAAVLMVPWFAVDLRIPTSNVRDFSGEELEAFSADFHVVLGNLEGQKDMLTRKTRQTLWKQSNDFWLDLMVMFRQSIENWGWTNL